MLVRQNELIEFISKKKNLIMEKNWLSSSSKQQVVNVFTLSQVYHDWSANLLLKYIFATILGGVSVF